MATNPPGAGLFTTLHFIVLGLLAVATIAAIIVGARRKRRRQEAERRSEEAAKEAGIEAGAPAEEREAPALDRPAVVPPPTTSEAPRPPEPEPTPALEPAPVAEPAPTHEPTPAPESTPAPSAPLAPVAAAEPAPAAPGDGPVTQLKGLGPKVATRLADLGITTVGQVAALDADQAADLDARLGPFTGRLHRDRWIEQARFLAAGDRAGFEAVFGKL